MDKLHLALTIFSIVIIVCPIVGTVYAYRDDLAGLLLSSELESLVSGDFSESRFQPPILQGQPSFDLATNTYTFDFKFTNPLQNAISLENISADIVCKEHRDLLGCVLIDQPMTTVTPGELVVIGASGCWSQAALDHFKISHSGPQDDDINVSFKNLNIVFSGVQVHIDEVADAGWVMMPPK
jgi:hypothetical protein